VISERQNSPDMLTLLRAFTWHYRRAKRWHGVRIAGALGFAAAAPIVTFWLPSAADVVAAIAGAWVLLGRTLIAVAEGRELKMAVTIQEQFDTDLFGLDWNGALAGVKIAPEDVTEAARHIHDDSMLRNWYASTAGVPRPLDILLCQRASAVWGRRTHSDYALTLAALGCAWFLAGLVMAVFAQLSLAGYLIKLFLPSQPAYLDAVDLFRSHWRQSDHKRLIERQADIIWDRACSESGADSVSLSDCRAIQNESYRLRRHGPQVAQWFFRLRRDRDEQAMRDGVSALVARFNRERGGADSSS
jgi:hypothetical protein